MSEDQGGGGGRLKSTQDFGAGLFLIAIGLFALWQGWRLPLGTLRSMGAGMLPISLAVSGIAGPNGGTPDKPVGTVWFGWARRTAAGVEVRAALTIGGFLQGLAKAAVFAILVSGVGCLAGIRTGQGPGAVGMSTTRAVVVGIVAIILADSVLGSFFYSLGI